MALRRRWKNTLKHHVSRNKCYIILLIAVAFVIVMYTSMSDNIYTGSKHSLYVTVFGDRVLPEPSQAEIDYFARYVNVSFAVEDNFASGEKLGGGGYYLASVTLTNTGADIISAKRWQLYGYFMRLAERNSYPYPNGFYLNSCGLKLFHVEGSLYRFEPSGSMFSEIKPYKMLKCKFKLQAFQVARTDSFPRWYVTGGLATPKVIANTDDETLAFVKDFKDERQFKKRIDDISHPYTTENRYRKYKYGREEVVSQLKVIPTPLEVVVDTKLEIEFNTNQWVIVKSETFLQEIRYFSDTLAMKIVYDKPMRKFIQITKAAVSVMLDGREQEHDEAYIVQAVPEKECIHITASTNKGVFYAFQTLRSIVYASVARANVGIPVMVPGFTIRDAPRFSYRGLHIDVARNFIGVGEILKVIDVLAMYKMNKLHLHLSDDEGWRLEIPGIPELTQVGASRCHDLEESLCILPMLGSGPYSNTSGSGYYDVGDYREILIYAKKRHIEIIPEIDMPGHSRAAVKSIHAKSQHALRTHMKVEAYSIIDLLDRPDDLISVQQFRNDVMNPCINSTYKFVRKIIKEVKKMHADIQPLKCYHFGGDEVAKGAWDGSPQCRNLMQSRKDLSSQYDLMKYFVNELTQIATEESLSVGAWEDAMISHDLDNVGIPFHRYDFKNKDIYVYVWKRPTEGHTPHRAKLFANKGYKVILAYGSYLYFDHPYEPDPEERGLYWATRDISTRRVWNFTPSVMLSDNHLDCPPSITNKEECFKLLKPDNVMGIQAELWTETVRTNEHVEYMLFPRLLAVAERAWHSAPWETMSDPTAKNITDVDWSKFINAVGYKELPRLDIAGIRYRIPPPGAIVSEGKAMFNTEFPGLDVEYFSTQSNSWELVSHNMPVHAPMKLRTRSTDGKRHSREVILNPT